MTEASLGDIWKAVDEKDFRRLQIRSMQASCAPHIIFKPKVYPDGNQWCALYGEDLMMGVCGFGDTPELACADFDKNWKSQTLHVKSGR